MTYSEEILGDIKLSECVHKALDIGVTSEALSIYLYVKIYERSSTKEGIKEAFGLGQARYSNAVKELKDKGLLSYRRISDPKTGRITANFFEVN